MLHPVAENWQEDMHNNSSNVIISIASQVPLVDPKITTVQRPLGLKGTYKFIVLMRHF